MSKVVASVAVIAVLALCVGLAARSMWKKHRSGKSSCGGDCGHCKGCR